MATVTADIVVRLGTERLQARLSVPEEPIRPRDLLPIARSILAHILQAAEDEARSEGKEISCKAGCGACCRQLVPISRAEARMIAELVENMPEPRRTHVRERFAEAADALRAGGLWDKLASREQWAPDEIERVALDYFQLGVPCPFLEEESCGIHPDRPLTCREYLVTSPAELCARPSRDSIKRIPLPVKVWPALARFDGPAPGARFVHWVPLTFALEPAEDLPEVHRPGPEMLQEFFRHLTGKPIPGQPDVPFGQA